MDYTKINNIITWSNQFPEQTILIKPLIIIIIEFIKRVIMISANIVADGKEAAAAATASVVTKPGLSLDASHPSSSPHHDKIQFAQVISSSVLYVQIESNRFASLTCQPNGQHKTE